MNVTTDVGLVLPFMDRLIPGGHRRSPWAKAIGWSIGDRMVMGVSFDYIRGGIDCAMSTALDYPMFPRRALAEAFIYPFRTLGCQRVTTFVAATNAESLRINERLGFRREGVLREGSWDGSDLIVFGMLERECPYIRDRWLAALAREVAKEKARETADAPL